MVSYPVRGIDVSDNNGHINWQQWQHLVSFGLAKATEGSSFTDDTFRANWEGMKSIGKYRFAYHFARPEQSAPGIQAMRFVTAVRNAGLEPHDHFVLDFEKSGLSAADTSFWGYSFCKSVNLLEPGHRVLVYTFPGFADAGNCAKLGPWHLWQAEWEASQLRPCGPWKTWAFWQYANGPKVDRDVWNGSEVELKKFCETTG